MRLHPYSARPPRACLQLIADVCIATWVYAVIEVARWVESDIRATSRPAYSIGSGAGSVASNLRAAGRGVAQVPLAGGPLSSPLNSAGSGAGTISAAARDLGDRISGAAGPTALTVALIAILPIALVWLSLRLRFALRAGASAELARAPGGDTLLALRALTRRSPRRLLKLDADPAAAWRRHDAAVVHALADLELRLSGVRRPRTSRQAAQRAQG